MVTGKTCWKKACIKDEYFRDYVHSSYDYFLRRFGLTPEANDIFRSIFTLDPSKRTTLSALRERVLKITSFGSGTEKIRKRRTAAGNLRLTLNVPLNLNPPRRQRRVTKASPPFILSSSSSSLLVSRPRMRPVPAICKETTKPTRVPRRKRATHTFDLPETPGAAQDIPKLVASPDSASDSDGPNTPLSRATGVNAVEQAVDRLEISDMSGRGKTHELKAVILEAELSSPAQEAVVVAS